MIVDTSALMAILLGEPEAESFARKITETAPTRISAGNIVELTVTATRRENPIPSALVDRLVEEMRLVVEPVTQEQALLARQAFLRFGRGRHEAALNFGDCFAYALSKAAGRPLLYKGDDFRFTDIEAARVP